MVKKFKISSFLLLLPAAALLLWAIGVTHSIVAAPQSHEMMHHTAPQSRDATMTCQVSCATTTLQSSKKTDAGRFVTQPEPLNLRYTHLLLVIMLPLTVTAFCLFLLSSWRPPDIPLLSGMYSVSL